MASIIVTRLRDSAGVLRNLGLPTDPLDEWIDIVDECGHDSMDGVDQTPMNDPAKRWRCSMCGVIGTHDELEARP